MVGCESQLRRLKWSLRVGSSDDDGNPECISFSRIGSHRAEEHYFAFTVSVGVKSTARCGSTKDL